MRTSIASRLKRWETIVALLASVASIAASGASITTELADDEPAAPSRGQVEQVVTDPSCVRMLGEVMDFVTEHPRAGRVYARVGRSGMPRLAAQRLIDACGDPETLVEEAGVVEPTGER